MLFNSYIFILLFLPLCITGYFSLNHLKHYALAQLFLLLMSFWFYGYFNPSYLIIMLVSICGNYLAAMLMDKSSKQSYRKIVLWVAIVANLGILFYFKYYDFFVSNINRLFASDFALIHVVLPLGISFFTFQQLSFVIDSYHGETQKYNFLQYASFVAYFPQLIAGPIVTHDELIPQFSDLEKKRFQWDNFARGIYIFALGLAKKVLVADLFGQVADFGYADVSFLDSTNGILVMLAYTFQVYFDFSGYCDMAIGLGRMMNLDLPINFDSPYKSLTITEFWKRWHKTLTRFFTRYVYIPLGGNRKGQIRTCLHMMVVFVVSGLWHGASWSFVIWGFLHGIYSVAVRCRQEKIAARHPVYNWLLTFAFVNFAWIFFRAERMMDAVTLIKNILSCNFGPIHFEIYKAFHLSEIVYPIEWLFGINIDAEAPVILLMIAYVGTLLAVLGAPNAYERMESFSCKISELFTTVVLLIWCIFTLSGVSTFLYFNF